MQTKLTLGTLFTLKYFHRLNHEIIKHTYFTFTVVRVAGLGLHFRVMVRVGMSNKLQV